MLQPSGSLSLALHHPTTLTNWLESLLDWVLHGLDGCEWSLLTKAADVVFTGELSPGYCQSRSLASMKQAGNQGFTPISVLM